MLSADDPSASSGITLRLLLRATPLGVGNGHGMPILTRFARSDARAERPYILTRFARSDTACRVPTFRCCINEFFFVSLQIEIFAKMCCTSA